jgi:6-phosphogluconate dehydrogenase (decarboxylating)
MAQLGMIGLGRAAGLSGRGIHRLDVGTRGGVAGVVRGYCLMIGGERTIFERLTPIFATLAPAPDAGTYSPHGSETSSWLLDFTARGQSRGNADNAHRVLSATRKQFGGHDENKNGNA